MGRKKTKNPTPSTKPLSTLIENPFGIRTPEILDAQNMQEELDLDGELQDELLREELEAQLQNLIEEESQLEPLAQAEEHDGNESTEISVQEDDSRENEDPLEEELQEEEEREIQDQEQEDGSHAPLLEDSELEGMEEILEIRDKDHLDSKPLAEETNGLELNETEQDQSEQEDSELILSSEEDTHADFLRLAEAVSQQISKDIESLSVLTAPSQESILQAQIAEDLALQVQEAQEELSTESSSDESSSLSEVQLDQDELQSCIEALLFISDKPLSREKLKTLLGPNYEMSLFDEALQALESRYQSVHHGIELTQVGGGYQFRTKAGRADLARKLVKTQTQRLSSGCMETLAIVAYRQPVMKEDIDQVRGVDSSYFIRGLLEKKLVRISGRSELPGRPLLYETTPDFLELFSLKDLSALPSLREIEQMIPASQSQNPDEDPKTRELRRLVGEMKADQSTTLYYNPKEDEKILKDIKDQVTAIPTSTPYLDELKAAEIAAKEQEKLLKSGQPLPEAPLTPPEAPTPSEATAGLG